MIRGWIFLAIVMALSFSSMRAKAGQWITCSSYPGGTVVVGETEYPQADIIECNIYDDGVGGGGESGGGGSGDGGENSTPQCQTLLATRLPGCNNPMAVPAGPFYGPSYNPNTAMWTLTNFASTSVTPDAFSNVRNTISTALSNHTGSIAAGGALIDVNAQLGGAIHQACFVDLPAVMDAPNSYYARRNTFQFCDAVTSRFDYEANGTYFESFANLFSSVGDFADLIPYGSGTVTRYLEGGNSLRVKFEAVARDSTCAHWWQQMGVNGCTG